MRIKDVNLGGGLYRLDVEPTCWGENINCIPTHAMDDIMRDVVKKRNSGCGCTSTQPRDSFGRFVSTRTKTWPCGCQQKPNREPDGIDAHIDRPRREMYGGWDAEWGFQNDMKKYRKAEEAIKACTWPCREPMQTTTPNYRNLSAAPCAPKATVAKKTTKRCTCKDTTLANVKMLLDELSCVIESALI